MSEQPEPEDGREADAFRAALARHADEVVPDVALPAGPAPRRGRWVAAGAAFAVAASAVVGFALLDRDRSGDGALDPAGDPPVIAEGWRGVTFRDVVVQVPQEWGDDYALDPSWCIGTAPTRPFVAIDASGAFIASVGCLAVAPVPAGFGPEPEDMWVPHLNLVDLSDDDFGAVPDGTRTHEGWTLRVRTLGDVQVRLLTDAATEGVADEILASAQRSDVGALGCDATSAAQEAPQEDLPISPAAGSLEDVDPQEVAALLVCQYDRGDPDRPSLRGERRIDGPAARAWLTATLDAPTTGGPDTPQNCLYPWESDMTLVVHPLAADGARLATAYVAYDACAGNGVRDADSVHELTHDNCASLFGGRVVMWSANGEAATRCSTPRR